MYSSHSARRGPARRLRAALAIGAATLITLAAAPSAFATHSYGALQPTTTVAPKTPPAGAALAGLPSSVDLTANAVAVGDQGSVLSCVSWAVGHHMVGFYAKRAGLSDSQFAPMYVYSQTNVGRNNVPKT